MCKYDMKKIICRFAFIAAALSVFLPVPSHAVPVDIPATTNDGYYFCMTEGFLLELISYMNDEDAEGVSNLLEDKKCAQLKGGLEVTVTQRIGILGSRIEIEYKGVRIWTYREAVHSK